MSLNRKYDFDRIDRSTKQITPALIGEVSDRIVQNLSPQQIFLFGSHAYGQAGIDSDIDLLVILGNTHKLAPLNPRIRANKLLDLFRYRSFGLDVIVLTQQEIEHLQITNEGEWDLMLEILEQGTPLYDQTQEGQTQRTRSPAYPRMVSQSGA